MLQINQQKPTRLDVKNKKILSLLVENARQPLSAIAKKCLLSRQSVEYRIKQMETAGLIMGYRTVIDVEKLGYKRFHVFLALQTVKEEKSIMKQAQKNKMVTAVISYRGKLQMELAFIIKTDEEFFSAYRSLLQNKSLFEEHILILAETITAKVLPFQADKSFDLQTKIRYSPDTKDRELLALLAEDALKTNTELGKELGLSRDTVAYRIRKLMKAGIITQFRPAINYRIMGESLQTILLKTQFNAEQEKRLEEFLRNNKRVLWAAKTLGSFNYIIYFLAASVEQFHEFFDLIRQEFSRIFMTYELLLAHSQQKYSFFPSVKVK